MGLVVLGQVDFRRPDHDRVVLHSNVQATRLDLLPAVIVDPAVGRRRTGSLAVSLICHAIVTSVSEAQSLIADRNDQVVQGCESPVTASGLPKDATTCPTGVRSRSRIEQTGSTIGETKSVTKPVTSVTSFLTSGESNTGIRRMAAGGTPNDTLQVIGDGEAPGVA